MASAVLSTSEREEDRRVARAKDVTHDDPYARVRALGYDGDAVLLVICAFGAGVAQVAFGFLLIVLSVLGLSGFSKDVDRHIGSRLDVVEVDLAPAEAPPPPPPVVEPEAKELPPPIKDTAPQPKEPTAAAPAQVAEALTAKDDPNAPVDLTNTIVTGSASAYAGGNSANNGTATGPVRNTAAPTGTGAGGGTAAGAPSVDQSRAAGLLGSTDWNCSSFWPTEADIAQIDEAVVRVQVSVKADGSPQSVKVLSDPGNGFGSAAIRCAMRQRFKNALDREGNAQPGTTNPFNVRFNR